MRIIVAVFDQTFWTIPVGEVRRLAAALTGDEVVHTVDLASEDAVLPDADVLFSTRLTRAQFARAGRLRWVHSSAVGVGGILSPEFVASPVVLTNTRGVHASWIAEHAIALILALRRQLPLAWARQAAHAWAQQEIYERRVPPLGASCMVVVGLGAIGSRVSDMAQGLGMTVVAVRRRAEAPAPASVTEVLPAHRIREALARADVVVLATPHTGETRHLIGVEELAAMKPGALLINVARGKLIDHDALRASLASGHLGGAALDAFEREPLAPDDPLWTTPGLVITPHTAAFGDDYWRPAVDLFIENVGRFRRGEALLNLVDKRLGY